MKAMEVKGEGLGCKMTFKIVIPKTLRALIHAITLILTQKNRKAHSKSCRPMKLENRQSFVLSQGCLIPRDVLESMIWFKGNPWRDS